MSKAHHNANVVKLTVMVGLGILYWVPSDYQAAAAFAVNCLWLWRT